MNSKNNSGFAMIEVLLAVVVLAIGLLAGSKMQLLGMNYTQGAQFRTTATMAANDIIDRMRVNPEGVSNGDYDDADTDALPTSPNCIAVGCTSAQLAAHDIRVWAGYFGKVAGANTTTPLNGARGTIDLNGGLHEVKITWTELIEGVEEAREVVIGVNFN
ncbi:MAG: type IV pilus modification protein PilV [Pseudomonadota bacterium]